MEAKGKVNSVRLSTDGPVLNIAGVGDVPFYEITEFSEASMLSNLMLPGQNPGQRSLSQSIQGPRHEF